MADDALAVLKRHWDEQLPLFKEIAAAGFAAYAAGLAGIEKAFVATDRVVRCIDERVVGGIHAAGSLLLVSPEEAAACKEAAGLQGVMSHAGCGAAKLHYLQNHPGVDPAGVTPEELDAYAQEQGRRIADELGLPYRGHVGFGAMRGPREGHIARVAYYAGTEDFDPSQVPGLPPGFVVSRRYLSREVAQKEAALAAAIAFDKDHAFGTFFSEEEPFYFVAVGDPNAKEFTAQALAAELAAAAIAQAGIARLDSMAQPA